MGPDARSENKAWAAARVCLVTALASGQLGGFAPSGRWPATLVAAHCARANRGGLTVWHWGPKRLRADQAWRAVRAAQFRLIAGIAPFEF